MEDRVCGGVRGGQTGEVVLELESAKLLQYERHVTVGHISWNNALRYTALHTYAQANPWEGVSSNI